MKHSQASIAIAVALAFVPACAGAALGAAQPFSWTAAVRPGFDSNPYLAPDKAYVDYAQAGTPLVVPNKQSGFYTEVSFDGEYRRSAAADTALVGGYHLDGDVYFDSTLGNADQYKHKLDLGAERLLKEAGKRRDTAYAGVYLGLVKEVYFDRDTGDQKAVGATDVSDRYSYQSIGAEAEWKNRTAALPYRLAGRYEQRNYEDPVVVSEYDHSYLSLEGDLEYRFARATEATVGYAYEVRSYDDRPSRDLLGRALVSNPRLEYQYSILDATLRHRIDKAVVAYFDLTHKVRTDQNVGYNDYTQNKFKVRVLYNPNDRLDLKAAAAVWRRDYPRAFAFDDPLQGAKESSGIDLLARAEYLQGKNRRLWAELDYVDQQSTDLRYEYSRYQVLAGFKWEY